MIDNSYYQYIKDELWLIKETEWVSNLQNIREAQFALGNGYLGTRGVLEEIPSEARPGTYIAGIYDKLMSQVTELVNFPNPFNFKLTVKGEKLDVNAMDVVTHTRTLNLKKALLVRRTEYKNSKENRFDYQSLRFFSMDDKNIGVMQIALTPLDSECVLDVNTGIDTSACNTGAVTEGSKRHFRVRELGQDNNAGYLVAETLQKKYGLIYWSGFYYQAGTKKTYAKDNIFQLKVKKGQTVVFTKVIHLSSYLVKKNSNIAKLRQFAFKKFNHSFRAQFKSLLNKHIKAWEKLWEIADVQIKGTISIQQNLRFNIYHMLICGHDDNGVSSVGARTLSGEGYKGHIFWDTEVFMFPFYLYTRPQIAKNMLLYRYNRLDKAREIAAARGYKGAMFSWESADDGTEQTPTWSKDINGKIVKIFTQKFEHHITADIVCAIYLYYQATEDAQFMGECGYEIIFEAARFWASRVKLNKKRNWYEINNIIGPDEFHVDVNNNAFTNMIAKWNLVVASKMFQDMQKTLPREYVALKRKIGLKNNEPKQWKMIAARIKPINMNKDGVIEQFDGYFKLKNVTIRETDENGIPILPVRSGTKDMNMTQLVKQPDVLMLVYLLSEMFNVKIKKANYDYYMPRTVHKSSLSPSISSIVASEVGDIFRAYHLFNVTLRADISNLYGNTHEGMHAASLGGTWQAVIYGFAGLSIKKERLQVNPRMPKTWNRIIFSFCWQACVLKFEVSNNIIQVKVFSSKEKEISLVVFKKMYLLKTNKTYSFQREEKQRFGFYY